MPSSMSHSSIELHRTPARAFSRPAYRVGNTTLVICRTSDSEQKMWRIISLGHTEEIIAWRHAHLDNFPSMSFPTRREALRYLEALFHHDPPPESSPLPKSRLQRQPDRSYVVELKNGKTYKLEPHSRGWSLSCGPGVICISASLWDARMVLALMEELES